MDKTIECRRIAERLGWTEVTALETLQEIGVPDAVHGDSVWLCPHYYTLRPGGSCLHHNGNRYVRELDFDPWVDANDDLIILEFMKNMTPSEWSNYKDALYHETKGHGTHNVWDYKKGKFANALVMWMNSKDYGGALKGDIVWVQA